jgi:hypothetical protein
MEENSFFTVHPFARSPGDRAESAAQRYVEGFHDRDVHPQLARRRRHLETDEACAGKAKAPAWLERRPKPLGVVESAEDVNIRNATYARQESRRRARRQDQPIETHLFPTRQPHPAGPEVEVHSAAIRPEAKVEAQRIDLVRRIEHDSIGAPVPSEELFRKGWSVVRQVWLLADEGEATVEATCPQSLARPQPSQAGPDNGYRA